MDEIYPIVDIYGKASEVELEAISTIAPSNADLGPICNKSHPLLLSDYSVGLYSHGWNCNLCSKVDYSLFICFLLTLEECSRWDRAIHVPGMPI
jgi:hypothetical protein